MSGLAEDWVRTERDQTRGDFKFVMKRARCEMRSHLSGQMTTATLPLRCTLIIYT